MGLAGADSSCDTVLVLGLPLHDAANHPPTTSPTNNTTPLKQKQEEDDGHPPQRRLLPKLEPPSGLVEEPSLTLALSGKAATRYVSPTTTPQRKGSCRSVASQSPQADDELADPADTAACARKKLRLTKDQAAVLEHKFKEHTTLNTKQKLALANQLNVRPRQVEVWFQNRRARTKLKQTEVDCEFLKRCCETLADENRRLHRELQELKAITSTGGGGGGAAFTMCPGCHRISGATDNAAATGGAINQRGAGRPADGCDSRLWIPTRPTSCS